MKSNLKRKRIEDIGLPDGISSSLRWHGNIKTLNKLIETDVSDLINISGIGEKKIDIIKSKVSELGLSINDSRASQKPTKVLVRNVEFPYNIIEYIHEQRPNFKKPEIITQDIINGIHFACLSLEERQQSVLYLRFECQQTLEKIAIRFSLSSTQVGNLIRQAVLTWFKTDDIKYIEYGLKGFTNLLVVKKTKALLGQISILEEYKKGYNDGYEDALNKIKDNNAISVKQKIDIFSMPVEELNLSIRAYNCIKRANINTVLDLVERTEEDMIRVRNLGKRSMDEIAEKLAEIGLSYRIESANEENADKSIFSSVHVDEMYKLKKIEFIANDQLFYVKHMVCAEYPLCELTIESDGNIKNCKYEIDKLVWNNFLDELVIASGLLSMSQKEFEDMYDSTGVDDDMTYTLKLNFEEKQVEYYGNTSSKGVEIISGILKKYLSPPENIQHEYFKMEDIW